MMKNLDRRNKKNDCISIQLINEQSSIFLKDNEESKNNVN